MVKRVHLIIAGDVQGVGFRAWTKAQAKALGVAGWVKNREDGAVEIVAEGAHVKLENFIAQCRKGPDVAWVEHVHEIWEEKEQGLVGFEVIY